MRTVTNFERTTVTIEERELLENYRVLDERGKHEVQEMITYQQFKRACSVSSREEQGAKQNNNIIRFRTSTV